MIKKEAQEILLKFDVRGQIMPDSIRPVIAALITMTIPSKKGAKDGD